MPAPRPWHGASASRRSASGPVLCSLRRFSLPAWTCSRWISLPLLDQPAQLRPWAIGSQSNHGLGLFSVQPVDLRIRHTEGHQLAEPVVAVDQDRKQVTVHFQRHRKKGDRLVNVMNMLGVHFVPTGVLQQVGDSDQSQRLGVCQSDFCCPLHIEMPEAAVAEVVGEELLLTGVPAFGTTRVEPSWLLRFAHEVLQQCEGAAPAHARTAPSSSGSEPDLSHSNPSRAFSLSRASRMRWASTGWVNEVPSKNICCRPVASVNVTWRAGSWCRINPFSFAAISRGWAMTEMGAAAQPVAFQPGFLGGEGQAALRKWSQPGPAQWRQVRPPGPVTIGLNGTGTSDGEGAERGQVDGLVVNTAEIAVPLNSQLHGRLRCWRDGCGPAAFAERR